MTVGIAAQISIRHIPRDRLPAAARLNQRVFGSSDYDVTPPAMLRLQQTYGGCMLGAFQGEDLVGFVPAFACRHDHALILYSAGLSVDPSRQSAGIGAALMQAMGEYGREQGYQLIKWTTNVIDSRNLYLYLNKVRATAVKYRPAIYVGLSQGASEEGFDGDDLEFDWCLSKAPELADELPDDAASAEARAVTRTAQGEDGERRLVTTAERPETDLVTVEVPWDGRRLDAIDRPAVTSWRRGLRQVLPGLFSAGFVTRHLVTDRRARRSFLLFTPEPGPDAPTGSQGPV